MMTTAPALDTLAGLKVALEFLEVVRRRLTLPLQKSKDELYVEGLWARLYLWTRSLSKLDSQDFQAATAAARAATELIVDIVLACREPGALASMRAWELVRGYQAGTEYLDFENGRPDPNPTVVASIGAKVAADREPALSALASHPKWTRDGARWSGRSLFHDLHRAHQLLPPRTGSPDLSEVANRNLRLMNWLTHGSTMLGVERIDSPDKADRIIDSARINVAQFAFAATRELYRFLKYDRIAEAMSETKSYEDRYVASANGLVKGATTDPQ